MDPITAGVITNLGSSFLSSLLQPPAPAGPTQAQIAAALEQRRREDEKARTAWLIGGGLVAVGVLGYVLLSRK